MADTNAPKLPPQAAQEVGGSGTYFFKGYISAEEYSIDLQGKYALQVYDVMRRSDPTIHAALSLCKYPILAAEWHIEPASNDPKDQEIAERANYEFFNRNLVFHEIMREGLTFLDFGHFVAELVYEPATHNGSSYIGLKAINSRKQRSILKWEQDDGTPGISQILPSGKAVNIPRSKLLVCVNDQEGENYYGVSMLRYAYKPWKIKDGLEIMNAIALENMALGIPYIKKGINNTTIDELELKQLRDRLRQQRVNEEAFLEYPASVEVGWTDMKSNSTKDVMPTIEYQDKQILLSVLGQFLLIGNNDAAGSRAVSQDHSSLFVKSLEAVAKQWRIAFQRDVLNQWVDLNYSNFENGYPQLVYSTISDEDTDKLATAVNVLMTAGALTPDRDIENRLRLSLNLPTMSDEDYEAYAETQVAKEAAKTPVVVTPTDPAKSTEPELPAPAGKPDDPGNKDQKLSKKEALAEARAAQKHLLSLVGE